MSQFQTIALPSSRPFQKVASWIRNHAVVMTDLVVLAAIMAFLLSYFEPHLLFSKTITTGGDTGSHYYTAYYLRHYLLPHGKISGWCQGNLAGYPMLQYYFPLPFLIMSILTLAVPLEIAFKWGVVMGTFLIPLFAYWFFRFLRQPFPVPAAGAVFTLAFLFNQGNSMWGGNIPSTLAGQFSLSLGLALSILWLGLLYQAVSEQRRYVACAILFALIGLSHGYALIFAGFASSFFLFTTKRFKENVKALATVYLLGFFLLAFYLLPLLAALPYTTRYSMVWVFLSWKQLMKEVFPPIFYPFLGMSFLAALLLVIRRTPRNRETAVRPWAYIAFLSFCAIGLYGLGYRMKVVDIRFIPFFQFFLTIGGAGLLTLLGPSLKTRTIACLMVMLLTFMWVDHNETFIRQWIRSNFMGFESKRLWDDFSAVNRFLKGSTGDSRVAYEYSLVNEQAGTVRAFENLPLFSGRSTLEGLQLPASLCVPAIFYLQSGISQRASAPFYQHNYSRFNLDRGIEHLKLFNVGELIVVEEETKKQTRTSPGLALRYRSGPYEVYEVLDNPDRYVVPVSFKPVLITEKDWRQRFYQWFRLNDLTVPLVFRERTDSGDHNRFLTAADLDVTHMPREPVIGSPSVDLKETVTEEEVLIQGASVGQPLLIKIAYHPNWEVDGADRIYLAAPGFMLIYPRSSCIRLTYGRGPADYIGVSMTILALLVILFWRRNPVRKGRALLSRAFDRWGTTAALIVIGAVIIAGSYYLICVSPQEYPVIPYHRGLDYYTRKEYETAKTCFQDILHRYPQSIIVDHAAYLYAMCFYNQKAWAGTIQGLKWLLDTYPETVKASESWYVMGLCYQYLNQMDEAAACYRKTVEEFSHDIWGRYAQDRLKEMSGR